MLRKSFITIILLYLILVLAGGTTAAEANQCTVENGQQFIDTGKYNKAIQEFSCVIESQPTEVEGYRGRIEAQLLLGQYSNAVRD